ncbi:MAG: YbgC/FadM family acyl-CoA thioesterase [Halarcobacter sp.]
MKIRVYYEDTDCGGVVYHSIYLNYCERARSELFFQKGLSPHNKDEFFVVKKVEADYIKPAVFGDELEVSAKLIKRKNTSLLIEQEIKRDEELIFKANILVVYLKNMKPTRIPQELIQLFGED